MWVCSDGDTLRCGYAPTSLWTATVLLVACAQCECAQSPQELFVAVKLTVVCPAVASFLFRVCLCCTLLQVHFYPHPPFRPPHTAYYTKHTSHSTLHTAHYTKHTRHITLKLDFNPESPILGHCIMFFTLVFFRIWSCIENIFWQFLHLSDAECVLFTLGCCCQKFFTFVWCRASF